METAQNIEPESNLLGDSNIPDGSLSSGRPGVILVNAGFLHRVGPNRMNTSLARKLASIGFASLRVDLSGLGDSMSRQVAAADCEVVSEDLDKAMDFMQTNFGLDTFVLVGLCSGANDTARKAMEDNRVVGLVNIDGTGYRTKRFYIKHFFLHLLRRVAQPERWRRLYYRYLENTKNKAESGSDQPSILMNSVAYTDWSMEETGCNFETLAQRKVKMHFVYTGGVSGFYNYRTQFWDIFKNYDFRGMASTSYFPATDHLTMLEHQRNEVHKNIIDWFDQAYT